MGECPTPYKIGYHTEGAADDVVDAMWRDPEVPHPNRLRVYQCGCGWWHVTGGRHKNRSSSSRLNPYQKARKRRKDKERRRRRAAEAALPPPAC